MRKTLISVAVTALLLQACSKAPEPVAKDAAHAGASTIAWMGALQILK